MHIISLGGVGGCELAHALRTLGQPSYPYDWLITTQSFIIRSFNDFDQFFQFDEQYVFDTTKLLTADKSAIMLHDFHNFVVERDTVIAKYRRRFSRLNAALLDTTSDILFVRICDNLDNPLHPLEYYNSIFDRECEDINLWIRFIDTRFIDTRFIDTRFIDTRFIDTNRRIRILCITNQSNIIDSKDSRVIIRYSPILDAASISEIIDQTRLL